MRISDWSSDVCSSDLGELTGQREDEDSRGHRDGGGDPADPRPLAENDDAEEGSHDHAGLAQGRDHAERRQGVGVDDHAVGDHRAEAAEVADRKGGPDLRSETRAQSGPAEKGNKPEEGRGGTEGVSTWRTGG